MPFLGDLNLFNGEQNPARNLLSVAVLLFFWSLHFTGSSRSKRDQIKSNFVRLYIYSAKCHRDVNFFLSTEYRIKDLHVTFPASALKGLLVTCGVRIEWWCFVIGQLLGGAW